ncbi:probable sphingolipid transporter spinster homolog 2 isoform X2 [Punica granatum]|uniref:Probable sphingolipid transporter spinster homolog 2 isoform X2 n=1 Tax=Punica granatum TaxID=22663 RepID=A0A6P8D1M4_PUNGR|nr:probable sphingolipid transporter spinster homolog 2 isoform X2 [Punica granatum]
MDLLKKMHECHMNNSSGKQLNFAEETKGSPETDMAEAASTSPSSTNPSWFSPQRLLVIFCIINMINYVDRGAIASNGVNGSLGTCSESGTCTSGSGIQGDFNLDNFEDGVLSSAFMVGLLIASPIFASIAKRINPFRLIGVGLSVWTAAVIGCGFSFDFWSIAICRMFVGVGEASFISLAAPFIDDNAPIDQKTAWLAIFYMCIPTGYALGYIYGGLVGSHLNWRFAFFGEAILMIPFAFLGFIMKPLQLKGFAPRESSKAQTAIETVGIETQDVEVKNDDLSTKHEARGKHSNKSAQSGVSYSLEHFSDFLRDMRVLLSEKVYVVNVLGSVAYNFVLGAYSYWGPKAGYSIYNMRNADYIFGGITVVCGIFGTLAGGFVLDYMNSTIPNAFKGPVNFINLHCVKPSLRALSMAMATVSIHIFGDVPSSPLVGVLQDYVNNWRETALILTAILFPAAGIWFIGIFLRSVDRFNEDSESRLIETDGSNTTPLLEENPAETTDDAR